MSHEALPIDAPSFSRALESLPIETLHAKAAEIQNSMAHLRSSNEQMVPFADEGDQDCKDAMFENLVVIGRMNERIGLLRAEVERRGMRWADAEGEERSGGEKMEGLVNGDGVAQGDMMDTASGSGGGSGRLNDEELAARMAERMAEDGANGEEEGVHL